MRRRKAFDLDMFANGDRVRLDGHVGWPTIACLEPYLPWVAVLVEWLAPAWLVGCSVGAVPAVAPLHIARVKLDCGCVLQIYDIVSCLAGRRVLRARRSEFGLLVGWTWTFDCWWHVWL